MIQDPDSLALDAIEQRLRDPQAGLNAFIERIATDRGLAKPSSMRIDFDAKQRSFFRAATTAAELLDNGAIMPIAVLSCDALASTRDTQSRGFSGTVSCVLEVTWSMPASKLPADAEALARVYRAAIVSTFPIDWETPECVTWLGFLQINMQGLQRGASNWQQSLLARLDLDITT
jgi:hypothetical protein